MLTFRFYNFLKLKNFKLIYCKSMSSVHKIAICQLTCSEDKDKNFNILKSLIEASKNEGAEVYITQKYREKCAIYLNFTLNRFDLIFFSVFSNFCGLITEN